MRPLPQSRSTALATVASLNALLAWDLAGLDLWVAGFVGTPSGFFLRDHWLLNAVLHDGARSLVHLLLVLLMIGVVWPFGSLLHLTRGRRLWLLGAVIGGLLLPATLKRLSATSCPWDLQTFGGAIDFVSHWRWTSFDDGPGHCFPAGHASAGFAWVAGFFAWPEKFALGRRWLVAGLFAGLVLGLAQQLRGAHFMSHTLWTAWICWTWAWCLSAWLPEESAAMATG